MKSAHDFPVVPLSAGLIAEMGSVRVARNAGTIPKTMHVRPATPAAKKQHTPVCDDLQIYFRTVGREGPHEHAAQ